jgi:hypothetical protein
MITISGNMCTPESGLPTIEDIMFGLSGILRFGGQTATPYTVLDHSLGAFAIAKSTAPENYAFQLRALLHDWHECLTGDIPTLFKTADMKALQEKLDERFYASIGLVNTGIEVMSVHAIDSDLLMAEASLLNFSTFLEIIASRGYTLPAREKMEDLRSMTMHIIETPIAVKMDMFVKAFNDTRALATMPSLFGEEATAAWH